MIDIEEERKGESERESIAQQMNEQSFVHLFRISRDRICNFLSFLLSFSLCLALSFSISFYLYESRSIVGFPSLSIYLCSFHCSFNKFVLLCIVRTIKKNEMWNWAVIQHCSCLILCYPSTNTQHIQRLDSRVHSLRQTLTHTHTHRLQTYKVFLYVSIFSLWYVNTYQTFISNSIVNDFNRFVVPFLFRLFFHVIHSSITERCTAEKAGRYGGGGGSEDVA